MYIDAYFYFRYVMFANWCKPVQKDLEENFRHAEVNKINSIQIKDNTTTSHNIRNIWDTKKIVWNEIYK